MAQRELNELSRQECIDLLKRQKVGRLVFHDELGPVAEPVNYAVAGDSIFFRVAGGSKRAAMAEPLLAFEVDEVDNDNRAGWSVIARGVGQPSSARRFSRPSRWIRAGTRPQ